VVFFNNLKSRCGSVTHGGDNRTGEGAGDDETIFVNLSSVPRDVESLYFVVNSYNGHPFSQVKNAFVRIVSGSREVVRFDLNGAAGQAEDTALLMAKFFRKDG